MCDDIGIEYDERIFDKPGWYSEQTWTEEQQEAFKEWLVGYLKFNKAAQREFLPYPNRSMKRLRKTAEMFVFSFGWRIDNSKQ